MAASLNKVFLMGNLTRDPELKYVPSGAAVANFTVAINRAYKAPTGEKKEEVSFIRVVVWGKMAEICGEYLTKGRPVLVEGRLKSRTWEEQGGQKRSAIDVVATSIQFIGARGEKNQAVENKAYKSDASSGAGYDKIESIDVDQDAGSADSEIPF